MYKHYLQIFKIIWTTTPGWTILRVVLLLLQAIVPLGQLYLTKLIIDEVTEQLASGGAGSIDSVLTYIILFGVITILNEGITVIALLVSDVQGQAVSDQMYSVLQEKSISVDLEYYENTQFHDTFHKAQLESTHRPTQILADLTGMVKDGFSLIGILGLFFFLHWSIGFILIIITLPSILVKGLYVRKKFNWETKRIPLERKASYFNEILTTDKFAKELRLFQYGKLFTQRFKKIRTLLLDEFYKIIFYRSWTGFLARISRVLGVIGLYVYVSHQTLQGKITLGDLVMYIQAFQRAQMYLQNTLLKTVQLYEHRLFLSYFFDFLSIESTIIPSIERPLIPSKKPQNIEFENVFFTYPQTQKVVLQNIKLNFKRGEMTAIVGKNGSGKTTLIKLLCRLYDPNQGAIHLDKTDIKKFSVEDYRTNISIIFQDFIAYHLSARQNIKLGNNEEGSDEEMLKATAKTGIDKSIKTLPNEYDNMLGRRFDHGAELSGGQWQKIALSRVFYQDADIIVLDEPTSAIDPLHESTIFEQLKLEAKNKIVILVTHRLYNLKIADKIIVMEEGKILQVGKHNDLINIEGTYKKMFEKQK